MATLARIIGLKRQTVKEMYDRKIFNPAEGGKGYVLCDAVKAYINTIKERAKIDQQDETELQKQKLRWQVENEKFKNLKHRLEYGEELAQAMKRTLVNVCMELRKIAPAEMMEAVRELSRTIEAIEPESIVLDVLAEEQESEAEGGNADTDKT